MDVVLSNTTMEGTDLHHARHDIHSRDHMPMVDFHGMDRILEVHHGMRHEGGDVDMEEL